MEEYFEASLSSVLRVECLGPVSYYLGILFEWSKDEKGILRVHLYQSAYVLFILDKFGFNMDSVDTKLTPFRSGNPIDSLPRDQVLPERLIKRYQSIESVFAAVLKGVFLEFLLEMFLFCFFFAFQLPWGVLAVRYPLFPKTAMPLLASD